MTSKISFSKLFKISLKNNIWGLAVSIAALLFSLPIYAGVYLTRLSYMVLAANSQELLHKLYVKNVLLSGNGLLTMMLVLCPAFNAIMGFRYLFDKSQCDLYHSLPLKRNELFTGNYVAGIAAFAVPYLAFDIITLIFGFSKKLVMAQDLAKIICFMLLVILAYAVIYSVAILAVMLTGTVMTAALATVTFFVYAPMIEGVASLLKSNFFVTYGWGDNAASPMDYLSPVNIGLSLIALTEDGKFDLKSIIVGIIALVILVFLTMLLYNKREIERAGSPIAYKIIEPVISVLLLVPAAIYGGLGANELTSNGGYLWQNTSAAEYGWVIFGCLITIVIVHFVIQAIFYADFKSLFKNLYNPLVAGLITAFVLCFFIFDLSGYDKKLPAYEDCAISSYAMQSGQMYVNFDAQPDDNGYISYWMDSTEYRYKNMKLKKADVDKILQKFIEETGRYKATMIAEKDSDVYSDTLAGFSDIQVRFTDKNGETKERLYHVNLKENLETYNALYTNDDYKNGVFEILNNDNAAGDALYIEDALAAEVLFKGNDPKLKEFLDTYRSELLAQDAYDLADSIPVAKIYFVRKLADESGYMSDYNYSVGAIYPSFTKTLKLIEDMGIDLYRYKDVDNIKEITVNRYDDVNLAIEHRVGEAVYENGEYKEEKYTDKADIARIMDAVEDDQFFSEEPGLHTSEAMEISASYINVPENGYEYQSFVLEKGKTF